jgi:hypothetical protein
MHVASRPGALSRKKGYSDPPAATSPCRVCQGRQQARQGQQAQQTNLSQPADGNCTTRIRRIKRCPRLQIAKLIVLLLKKLKKSAILKKNSPKRDPTATGIFFRELFPMDLLLPGLKKTRRAGLDRQGR